MPVCCQVAQHRDAFDGPDRLRLYEAGVLSAAGNLYRATSAGVEVSVDE